MKEALELHVLPAIQKRRGMVRTSETAAHLGS